MDPFFLKTVREQIVLELSGRYSKDQISWEEYVRTVEAIDSALRTLLQQIRENSEKRDRHRGGYRYDNVRPIGS